MLVCVIMLICCVICDEGVRVARRHTLAASVHADPVDISQLTVHDTDNFSAFADDGM